MKKKNKKPNQNKKLDGWAQKSVKSTEERIGELEIGKWKLPILDSREYEETLRDVGLLQKSRHSCYQSPGKRE